MFTLLLIIFTLYLNVAEELAEGIDFHGMRFSCGVDSCSVPYYYCDKEDGSCLRCNSDICNGDFVDAMCNYYCDVILKAPLESTTVGNFTEITPTSNCKEWITTFYALVTLTSVFLLSLVILIFVFVWKCRSWKQKQKDFERDIPVSPIQDDHDGERCVSGN